MTPSCILCGSQNTSIHFESTNREYWKCTTCKLVFVPSKYHLPPKKEKAIYDQHQNNPNDLGYRNFLNRLTSPLVQTLNKHQFSTSATGLDFGSGPGPTLSLMLEELGYRMSIYDIYYANNHNTLKQRYDFITSTEVWEHLSQPHEVIDLLFNICKDKCVLGVMTKRIPNIKFGDWHYIKDPTHITFFADETFQFIANKYECELSLPSNDTALFIRDNTS